MTKPILITVLIVALTFAGFYYFSKNSSTDISQKPLTIIAFGDSLTAGYGVDIKESYPSILQDRLRQENPNITVLNMGISGETSSQGLNRVQSVIDQKPDLVLLELGANDMLRSVSVGTVQENLDAMLKAFDEADISVILIGMRSFIHTGPKYVKEFDAVYQNLANKYGVPVIPFFLEGVALRGSLNLPDGLHPNAAGYVKIVDENVLPVVQKFLKNLI